jgi:hypothetical protein
MAFGGPIGGKARTAELHILTTTRAATNIAVLFSISHTPFNFKLNPMQNLLVFRTYYHISTRVNKKLSPFSEICHLKTHISTAETRNFEQ